MSDVIVVVDYGLGNRGSILNMLSRIGANATVSNDPATIASARKLILPGVGAFDAGIRNLRAANLEDPLKAAVEQGAFLLGICLGMQLLSTGSEEGALPGLGLIPGRCVKFLPKEKGGLSHVPHMGWAQLDMMRKGALFSDDDPRQRYYFVHSYHFECDDSRDVVAKARAEASFVAAIERNRVFGCQFHPEKSHRFGMAVIQAFTALNG